MPTVLRIKGDTFFFYSNEGSPLEPPHIHVRSANGEAKIWLCPVLLAKSKGDNARALREILEIVTANAKQFEADYERYFSRFS